MDFVLKNYGMEKHSISLFEQLRTIFWTARIMQNTISEISRMLTKLIDYQTKRDGEIFYFH